MRKRFFLDFPPSENCQKQVGCSLPEMDRNLWLARDYTRTDVGMSISGRPPRSAKSVSRSVWAHASFSLFSIFLFKFLLSSRKFHPYWIIIVVTMFRFRSIPAVLTFKLWTTFARLFFLSPLGIVFFASSREDHISRQLCHIEFLCLFFSFFFFLLDSYLFFIAFFAMTMDRKLSTVIREVFSNSKPSGKLLLNFKDIDSIDRLSSVGGISPFCEFCFYSSFLERGE